MDRRAFLQWLGLGPLVINPVTRSLAVENSQPDTAEHHWAWIRLKPEDTPDQVRELFAEYRAAGSASITSVTRM